MEQSKLYWIFFRSLAITIAVSLAIAVGIGYMTGSLGIGIVGFFTAIIVQIALASIVSNINEKRSKENEFIAQQILKEASELKIPYDLSCAYCNTLNRVGITFTAENIFECTNCNQPNKVYIQFSTVRITTPLTRKESNLNTIDMESDDVGVGQTTINKPIRLNEP